MKLRVDFYCHNQRLEVAGRIMTAWFRLDGDDLVAFLGDGFEGVFERAVTAEIKKQGNGVLYIAGAVERATKSRVSAAEIMAGRYRAPEEKSAEVGASGEAGRIFGTFRE